MKKAISLATIIVIVACIMLVLPFGDVAYAAELTGDECDQVFLENIAELYENDVESLTISATKETVFDMDLEPLGCVYDFCVNGENGYAIVVNTNGQFDVTELFFDSVNPYASISGTAKRIYVSTMTYLGFDEDEFRFLGSETAVPATTLESLREIALSRGGSWSSSTEYVYYTNRSETNYNMAARHPGLYYNNLTAGCAPIAGGNLVMYWDRYKTNLIANYTPGSTVGSSYLYKNSSSTTDSVILQLYTDMGTSPSGTTASQFMSGISTYCTRQGYTASFTSLMSGGSFNYNAAKQQIVNGEPIALFLQNCTVGTIQQNSGNDYIDYIVATGDHVMAGFGYKEVTYTLTGGNTRVDYYIAVASGVSLKVRGFFNINYNTQIDNAYSLLVT